MTDRATIRATRRFGPQDYLGLTPLMWAHAGTHGGFTLGRNSRLSLAANLGVRTSPMDRPGLKRPS